MHLYVLSLCQDPVKTLFYQIIFEAGSCIIKYKTISIILQRDLTSKVPNEESEVPGVPRQQAHHHRGTGCPQRDIIPLSFCAHSSVGKGK